MTRIRFSGSASLSSQDLQAKALVTAGLRCAQAFLLVESSVRGRSSVTSGGDAALVSPKHSRPHTSDRAPAALRVLTVTVHVAYRSCLRPWLWSAAGSVGAHLGPASWAWSFRPYACFLYSHTHGLDCTAPPSGDTPDGEAQGARKWPCVHAWAPLSGHTLLSAPL